MTLALATLPHALYRFYDRTGALLYVGLTADPGSRWKAHARDKPWWLDVTDVRIEHFPDRKTVTEAERVAIQREKPRYNVVHNARHGAVFGLDDYLSSHVAARLIPNRDLSVMQSRPEPPPFGQWLQDLVETGAGYDWLAWDLAAAPGFKPAMNPGQVELVLHMQGLLDKHAEDFTEAREIHNHLREVAGVVLRTDVFDLRADLDQIWSSRTIWVSHAEASVVRLDRFAYMSNLRSAGCLSQAFRRAATLCLQEGLRHTDGMGFYPGATTGVTDRSVGLIVPRRLIGDTVAALLDAELNRGLGRLERLASDLGEGPVR